MVPVVVDLPDASFFARVKEPATVRESKTGDPGGRLEYEKLTPHRGECDLDGSGR